MMRLCLMQIQSQVQELQATGGATETVFPEAERLLQQTEYQKALKFVASRKSMDSYASMMDFLLCETFTNFRFHCRRHYNDRGPQLKHLISERELYRYRQLLVHALNLAKSYMETERHESWAYFSGIIRTEWLTIK